MLRRVVSRLLPPSFKRAIDRWRTRRFLATVTPATVEYVESYGLEVRHGPFTGLAYLPGLERSSGDLVAKLLGSYECELHAAVGELVAGSFSDVIDVGCAEGYYAVGLARAMPQARIHAYDIDATARADCLALARRNGVETRVAIAGACAPEDLAAFPARDCALFCDCEGYEMTLLDPDAAPVLRNWWILVELHDFADPAISASIASRFAATHHVELIASSPRDPAQWPELAAVDPRTAVALLSERRPGRMEWAVLRPRADEAPA